MTLPVTSTAAEKGSSPFGAILGVIVALIAVGVFVFLLWRFYLRTRYDCKIQIPFIGRTITVCQKPEKILDPESSPMLSSDEKKCQSQDTKDDKKIVQKNVERSNPYFVETKVYRDIISKLEKHNVVLVVGKTGIGKTATCVGVLEHYRDILEWKIKYPPADTLEILEERTIVLIDVPFGDVTLYSRYDPSIEKSLNLLYTNTHNLKQFKILVASSRSLKSESDFPIFKRTGFVEFSLDHRSYEEKDLTSIFENYTCAHLSNGNKTRGNSEEITPLTSETINEESTAELVNEKVPNLNEDGSKQVEETVDDRYELKDGELSDSRGMQKKFHKFDENNDDNGQSMSSDETKVDDIIQKTRDECSGKEEDDTTKTVEENKPNPIQINGQNVKNTSTDVQKDILMTQNTDCGQRKDNVKVSKRKDEEKTYLVSDLELPLDCYIPSGMVLDIPAGEIIDPLPYCEEFVSSLADSINDNEKQKYSALVYIMLQGSNVLNEAKSLHRQLLLHLNKSLTPDRFFARVTEMVENRVLLRRGNMYSFSNDLILFSVIKSFATREIGTFIVFGYLPFITQFLQPKSAQCTQKLVIEIDDDWNTLCEIGTLIAKRNKGRDDVFKDFGLLESFTKDLQMHEDAMMKKYKIENRETMDNKKRGNALVRKMINHHPYLKEYYGYAEPEKFKSIPESAFKIK